VSVRAATTTSTLRIGPSLSTAVAATAAADVKAPAHSLRPAVFVADLYGGVSRIDSFASADGTVSLRMRPVAPLPNHNVFSIAVRGNRVLVMRRASIEVFDAVSHRHVRSLHMMMETNPLRIQILNAVSIAVAEFSVLLVSDVRGLHVCVLTADMLD
jgi:hypothetical protein